MMGPRILLEFIVELGVGHLNHGLRALAQGLSMQIGDAVLGDYEVHVASAGDHSGAGAQGTP